MDELQRSVEIRNTPGTRIRKVDGLYRPNPSAHNRANSGWALPDTIQYIHELDLDKDDEKRRMLLGPSVRFKQRASAMDVAV